MSWNRGKSYAVVQDRAGRFKQNQLKGHLGNSQEKSVVTL